VRNAVAAAGYTSAFTAMDGLNHWEDPFTLRRVSLSEMDTPAGLMIKLATGRSAASHSRRLLIAAAKGMLRLVPGSPRARLADWARLADESRREQLWKRRTQNLMEAAARAATKPP
jgi:hypothetical protein